MSAPAITPSSALATASSQSLCVWMPIRTGPSRSASARRTASTPCLISAGMLPPFVSHRTTHDAPARAAARQTSSAYSESLAKPSEVLRIDYQLPAESVAVVHGFLFHRHVLAGLGQHR